MKLVILYAQNSIISYKSPQKSIAKIQVDIPIVDFVYLKNVGLSGCLLWFDQSVSSRPSI